MCDPVSIGVGIAGLVGGAVVAKKMTPKPPSMAGTAGETLPTPTPATPPPAPTPLPTAAPTPAPASVAATVATKQAARAPNIAALRQAALGTGVNAGNSSTLLTGPGGVDLSALNLGKPMLSSLLGS